MHDIPETPEERLQRRRARRWKRRARIVGPFLGVPILLAALSLSVDLIEYRPQPTREKLTDRPIRMTPRDARRSISEMPITGATSPPPSSFDGDMDLSSQTQGELVVTLPPSTSGAREALPVPTPPEVVGR